MGGASSRNSALREFSLNSGAEEGTRTPTPLRVHGPEPCASANSATSARHCKRGSLRGYLQGRTASTILQTLVRLSNLRSRDSAERQTAMVPTEDVTRVRSLTHDLSNSMETILQASYLLAESQLDPNTRRWVEMIEEAARDAAQINRQIREILRSQP